MESVVLEEGYLAASLIEVKERYLGESFASFMELRSLKAVLEEVFLNMDMNFKFNSEISLDDFDIFDGMVVVRETDGRTTQDIIQHYKELSCDICPVLWNQNFILQNITRIRSRNRLMVNSTYLDWEDIDCFSNRCDDASFFFRRVGRNLEDTEYDILCSQVMIPHACFNCDYRCRENFEKLECPNWKNDLVVGKEKVLRLK